MRHIVCPTFAGRRLALLVMLPPVLLGAHSAAEGVAFLHPLLNFREIPLLERQMYECWDPLLGLTAGENARAIQAGIAAQTKWLEDLRERGRAVLDELEAEGAPAASCSDAPISTTRVSTTGFSKSSGNWATPSCCRPRCRSIQSPWNACSAPIIRSTSKMFGSTASPQAHRRKVWAAKFVARHPNLIGIEISNFKCGHDAPAYQLIQAILELSGKPYFSFRDLDENRPIGSLKIRIETIDYYLRHLNRDSMR